MTTLSPHVRDALLSIMVTKKIVRQAQFAKSLKLSTGYVCDVLALRRNVSPDVIDRIGEVYGLTRKHVADLHHRAAIVAGFRLAPLPAEDRIEIVKPEAGALMRETKPKAKAKSKAKPKAKAKVRAKAKAPRALKVKGAVKPKAKPAAKPKPVSKPAPKAKPVSKPKVKPVSKPKVKPAPAASNVTSIAAAIPVMPAPVAHPEPDPRDIGDPGALDAAE